MNTKNLLFILLFVCLVSSFTIKGKVVRVSDGDTFTVLTANNKQERVRMLWIDAPEKSQPYGDASRQFLADIIVGKIIEVNCTDKDRYGRNLGYVVINDTNINELMLEKGYAWHYKQFDKNADRARLEQQARANKLGLWREKAPIAPWLYRRNKK